jgi:hypothetical protein
MLILFLIAQQAAAQSATKDSIAVLSRPDTDSANGYYISNRYPLKALNFIKLPIGSIQPEGWVLKYLELQRDGLTGHLGEISAWLDKNNNAWYNGTGRGGHGWEEVPYWLKGYGDLGYLLKDEKMIAVTRDWLNKIFQSQRADGYFGPSTVENGVEANTAAPDLWPNMIVLWCMQSWYEFSRDARVLPFMTKYFHWQNTVPDSVFLKVYWENSRGGDNLFSVYWLYNITGDPELLVLAEKIHHNTANWAQDGKLPNWHNVNVAQCFREPATYYLQSGDSFFLKASYKDYDLIRQRFGQVPGGMFGADENAREGYSDPRQAVETCGMVEQMASDELMMGITGDPAWADNCEDVAFNTYPAAVMPDFRGLRYLTAPNMVVSDTMDHSPGIQNGGPFLVMNPFSSRCCQHNHAQGWPYYAEHLWMATPDNGLAAMLYCSNTVSAEVGDTSAGGKGRRVILKESSHYPFEEGVRIRVETTENLRFPLYLRIPGWCRGAALSVNGVRTAVLLQGGQYARIERVWRSGDLVELSLPMEITLRTWSQNKNSVSVNYGPLSFSLKIKENYSRIDSKSAMTGDSKFQPNADPSKWPAFEIRPGTAWNYGLILKKGSTGDFTVKKRDWPKDDFPFTQESAPIEIETKAKRIPSWTIDQYGLCGLLPQSPVKVSTVSEKVELIPMGAARLRISAFPVVQ